MKYAKRMLALMLIAVPVIAAAQLRIGDRVVAKVPFRFMVADKYVPAGECTLQKADMTGRTLIIRNVEAGVAFFANASIGDSKKVAGKFGYQLVFNKYGDRYFLSEMRAVDSGTTYSLVQSKEESELRAQNATVSERTVIATRQ